MSAITIATASPTNRTRPFASSGRRGSAPVEPSRFSTGVVGRLFSTPAASIVSAVSTAWTPGIPSAPDMSSDAISACATGERST